MTQNIFQKLNYFVHPYPEKCCKKCVFCFRNCVCSYMDAYIDAYVVRGTVDSDEIDLYGACDHFFSLEHAKLLKDCASVAEFNLKKEIFGIELDPLLLTEIEDGFNECEIATPKMVEYAIRIHNVLYPMNEEVMTLPLAIDISRLPLAIDISRHFSTEKFSPVMIDVSHNFHRMSAYIKNNKSAYSKYSELVTP